MKKTNLIKSLAAIAFLFAGFAQAHTPTPATIKGKGIELMELNHAFAGAVLDVPVFAAFNHNPFGGELVLRLDETTVQSQLAWDANNVYSGTIKEVATTLRTAKDTSITFEKIEKDPADEKKITIVLKTATETVRVLVEGDSFADDHFSAPKFSTTINGKAVEFKFTGESCYGYSTNIAMLVLNAWLHVSTR